MAKIFRGGLTAIFILTSLASLSGSLFKLSWADDCPVNKCSVCGKMPGEFIGNGINKPNYSGMPTERSKRFVPYEPAQGRWEMPANLLKANHDTCHLWQDSRNSYWILGCVDNGKCEEKKSNEIKFLCDGKTAKSATDCELIYTNWLKSNATGCSAKVSCEASGRKDAIYNCTIKSKACMAAISVIGDSNGPEGSRYYCPPGTDKFLGPNTQSIPQLHDLVLCRWKPSGSGSVPNHLGDAGSARSP